MDYYPTDLYREPMPNFPEGFTIDVREVALPKLRHLQEKLAAKEDVLQLVVDAIEQAPTRRHASVTESPERRDRRGPPSPSPCSRASSAPARRRC